MSGRINPIDDIFHNYDVEYLLNCDSDKLANSIRDFGCSSQSTWKQMKALISKNITILISLEQEYGSIDSYYQKFIDKDNTLKTLVKQLADPQSEDKLQILSDIVYSDIFWQLVLDKTDTVKIIESNKINDLGSFFEKLKNMFIPRLKGEAKELCCQVNKKLQAIKRSQ